MEHLKILMAAPGGEAGMAAMSMQASPVQSMQRPAMMAPAMMIAAAPASIQRPSHTAAGAPDGSWQCVTCGNVNFPTRFVCNGRNGSCGLPRPPQHQHMPVAGLSGLTMGIAAAMQRPMQSMPQQSRPVGGGNEAPAGAWACGGCGNVNWPTRIACNGKKGACGLPRQQAQMNPGVFDYFVADEAEALAAAMAAAPAAAGCVGGCGLSQYPMWVCLSCGNENYASRMTCNGKSCGLPRASCDSGAPGGGLPATMAVLMKKSPKPAPEGSWVCSACNNINWPAKVVCNARVCGRPRSEVDAGPAEAYTSG